jgi:ADP-ribosyl-[dinitrogen reductase] hydrolase
LLAANSGGDADTNAAIAGQIAGAFYGYSEIPQEWCDILYMHDCMENMFDLLISQ